MSRDHRPFCFDHERTPFGIIRRQSRSQKRSFFPSNRTYVAIYCGVLCSTVVCVYTKIVHEFPSPCQIKGLHRTVVLKPIHQANSLHLLPFRRGSKMEGARKQLKRYSWSLARQTRSESRKNIYSKKKHCCTSVDGGLHFVTSG